ncbi:NERD domain-containing protein [Bacillus sp. RD4P76]|uniref:NERD domain-containing protein n=2 Tax=Bacillus suaedaesalsae TaxID=2810349 RepID=A0ABS2DMF2_9BACI|nr:NERD domain-containing protein [Bacillus suaedaesalsae]
MHPSPKQKTTEHTAVRKGEIGEYKIDIQLDQLPKEYKHLSDLLVENPRSKSGFSQIDHVIITPFGIFVIETKNYQGTIYGGKERKTWSVNGKFKMMNPFVQNYGHIQALKQFIDSKYHHLFISMVSFTKRSTFKLDELDIRQIGSNDLIVYDVELSDFIHRKVSVQKIHHKEPLISETEINAIYQTLQEINITDTNDRELHVKVLKGEVDSPNEGDQVLKVEAVCATCNKQVSEKVRAFCLSNKKFNGKIYCFEHQKISK